MKKILLYLGISLSVLAVGCSNGGNDPDPKPDPSGKGYVTISATVPYEGFSWEAEDAVCINSTEYNPTSISEDGYTATFVQKNIEAPVFFVSPAKLLSGLTEVTLPSRQLYISDEAFDPRSSILYGYASELIDLDGGGKAADIELKTIVGGLCIPVVNNYSETIEVSKVDIVSNTDNDSFAGEWEVKGMGLEGAEIALVPKSTVNNIHIVCDTPVAIAPGETANFNVVLPAGSYASGLDITISDKSGLKCVYNTGDEAANPAFDIALTEVTTIDAVPFVINPSKPETMTLTINEAGVKWAAGSKVIVNGEMSAPISEGADTNVGKFAMESVAYPYEVFYPEDLYSSANTVRFYHEQKLASGTPDVTAMAMVGYSKTPEVTMYNLCGFVVLPIVNACDDETITINKVVLESADGEALCGKFDLNYKNHKLTGLSAKTQLNLIPDDGEAGLVLKSGESATIYAVVPATKIKTLNVTVDSSMEVKTISVPAVEVKAGENLDIPEYKFADIKIEKIETAAQFSAFMKALAKGSISRFLNEDGEVLLGADLDMTGIVFEPVESWIAKFNGDGHVISNLNLTIKNMAADTYLKKVTFENLDASNGGAAAPFIAAMDATAQLINVNFNNSVFGHNVISELSGVANALKFTSCSLAKPAIDKVTGELSNTTITNTQITKTFINNVATLGLVQAVDFVSEAGVKIDQTKTAVLVNGILVATNNGTVDGCTVTSGFKFTGTVSANSFVGGIVGLNTGLVSNCTYNGEYVFEGATVTGSYTAIACVVGKSDGIIEGCTNNGNLTLTVTTTTTGHAGLGGIVGYAGVDGKTDVFVKNCTNNGNITYKFNGATKKMAYWGVGGVIGMTPTVTVKAGSQRNYNCGSIEGCTNFGTLYWLYKEGGSGAYGNLGGVAGIVSASMKDCVNRGSVTMENGAANTAWTGCKCAGVAGTVIYDMINCDNYGDVQMKGRYAGGTQYNHNQGCCPSAYSSCGGVVGNVGIYDFATFPDDKYYIRNCHNYTSLTVEPKMVNSGGPGFAFGGVAGCSADIMENCTNEGDLTLFSQCKTQVFGGVCGYACDNVVNCENKGNLIDDQDKAGYYEVATYIRAWFGGIVGYTYTTDMVIENCKNSGSLKMTNSAANSAPTWNCIGGIVGTYNKSFIMKDCQNSGDIVSEIPQQVRAGGIAGAMNGTVSNTTNTGAVNVTGALYIDTPDTYDTAKSSAVGGLAGYSNSNWTNCKNTATVTSKSQAKTLCGGLFGSVGGSVSKKVDDPTLLRAVIGCRAEGSVVASDGILTGILTGGRIMQNDSADGTYTAGTYLRIGDAATPTTVSPSMTVNGAAVTAADLVPEKLSGITDGLELDIDADGLKVQ